MIIIIIIIKQLPDYSKTMEAALKAVFIVHRNVVKGLKMQLYQVKQERDELKNKLDQSHKQLEEASSRLKEETCILHNVINQCQADGHQSVRSSEQASSPMSPSNKHQETTKILEEHLHILVQTLRTASQQLQEACSQKPSADEWKQLVGEGDREQNKGSDDSQHSMRVNAQSQQIPPRDCSQAAGMKADKLFEKPEDVLCKNKMNLNGMKSEGSGNKQRKDLPKLEQQKKAEKNPDCYIAGKGSMEEIGHVARHADRGKEVKIQIGASEKSPEQGSKLQLLRNAAKRRRYTEEDSRRKWRKLHTNKSDTCRKEDMCAPLGVPPAGDRSISSHSQCLKHQNASHQCGSATSGGKSLPVPQNRQAINAECETKQDSDTSQSCSDLRADDMECTVVVNSQDLVCAITETLGMDLSVSQPVVQTEEQSTVPSSRDGEIEKQQDSKEKCNSFSANRNGIVKVMCHSVGRNLEKSEKRCARTQNGERRSNEGSWPTDSVVFSSAGPRLGLHVVAESVSTDSLYCDAGHKVADCQSPVFSTHHKEPQTVSPALFDEVGDTDSVECISSPPVTILTRNTIHNPEKQPITIEKPTVDLMSQNLVQPPHQPGGIACNKFSHLTSKSLISSSCALEAHKSRVSVSQALQAVEVAHSPGGSACSGLQESSSAHGIQTDTTQSTAWAPAPQKMLFRKKKASASPSADDTVNPCLLDGMVDDSIVQQAVTDLPSWQGDGATVCSQLNASLDPDVRLTQYLQEPTVNTQTACNSVNTCELAEDQDAEEDFDVTLDPRFQRLHQTSGQDVTHFSLSSTDQADTDCQHSVLPVEHRPTTGLASLNNSFDRVPQKKTQASYAFTEVVRKQAERKKLKAFACRDCEKYYSAMGLGKGEMRQKMAQCSRHRARQAPPSTPDHFWSIGFPDTPV